jgi:WXG100 family type VII secretion target
MANLNVTYQDLNDTANKLKSGKADIESKLSELKRAVDQLISAGFQTDKASGAFGESYSEFTTGVTQTIQGLEGMSKFLTVTAEAFEDIDSQLSTAIRG